MLKFTIQTERGRYFFVLFLEFFSAKEEYRGIFLIYSGCLRINVPVIIEEETYMTLGNGKTSKKVFSKTYKKDHFFEAG